MNNRVLVGLTTILDDKMKSIKWLLGGVVLGIVVTSVSLYLGTRFILKHPDILNNRKSVMLSLGEMLLVKTKDGTALIDFTNYGKDGTTSSYRWRFKPRNGSEVQGTSQYMRSMSGTRFGPTNTGLPTKEANAMSWPDASLCSGLMHQPTKDGFISRNTEPPLKCYPTANFSK